MKKLSVALLVMLLICLCGAVTHAFSYPHAFWSINEKYQTARNSNNYRDIIAYGNQTIDLFVGMEDSREKRDILVSRYGEVAKAYATLGDWENSAKAYERLYNYAKPFGSQYAEIVKGAKAKYEQYTPVISIYSDNGKSPYYGAKNEKENGVLFGLCSNGATRSRLDNESMVLVYQELGQALLPYNTNVVRQASEKGIAVEFALNCPKEAEDIKNIRNLTSYLEQISDMLGQYSNIPVYLRFGAEFDVWTSRADGEPFKEAFRYVSNYFRTRNSNVAIVWSPNQVSNWNVDIDDYYPGDDYVDWVGVSSYAEKYFLGGSGQEDEELFFKAGINSEPVIALKDIIDRYGDRKPIMLSESGCAHRLVKSGEDTSDFAMRRIKEYYSYLPMVYPQIKLIAYFDHYVEGSSEKNDFRLSTNETLQNEYIKLTKGARFIQDKYENDTSFCYRKIGSGNYLGSAFVLSCYAHRYDNEARSVTYFIDDKYVGMSNEIPFSTYVNAGDYTGEHNLKAVASFADGQTSVAEYVVNFMGGGRDITVEISGDEVEFDQNPVIYNERTMVPMRKIFEELGAVVSWDDTTKTATGTRGDRAVRIAIGNSKMYINHKQVLLDTAPIILSDRTLVPVRAVAEGLGCDVDWDGQKYLVSITPNVFDWSEWDTSIPNDVDDDLFYIESKEEYRTRTRTRDMENYTSDTRLIFGNYVRTDTSYGKWSNWSDSYISETDNREVDTRTVEIPVRYKYYHYCMNEDGGTDYHEIGMFDERLTPTGGGNGDIYYTENSLYECENGSSIWYEQREGGGSYTQYRSRPIYYEYVYWRWSDWSGWSKWTDWQEGNPVISRAGDDDDTDTETDRRTMYRYKEK